MTEKGYQDWEVVCYQYWKENIMNGRSLKYQDWEGEDTRIGMGKETSGLSGKSGYRREYQDLYIRIGRRDISGYSNRM